MVSIKEDFSLSLSRGFPPLSAADMTWSGGGGSVGLVVTFQILLSRRRAAQLDFLPSWGNQQAPPLKVNPSLASFAKNLHIRAKARPGSVPLRIVKDLQKVQNPEQPMYSVPKVMLPRSLTLAEMR